MSTKTMIPIWFFVGCLLAVYGALILLAGFHEPASDAPNVAMANLHLQIWWGVGLLGIGVAYVISFRPRRSK
jgi:FtsH-binding integral membrane protein